MKGLSISGLLSGWADIRDEEGIRPLLPSSTRKKRHVLIIDSTVSFFKAVEIPEDAKVNKEFVELNYLQLSPFPGPAFSFFRHGRTLMLWFYPALEAQYPLTIPEDFLVWKGMGLARDALAYVDISNRKRKFFVFRDGMLSGSFVKSSFSEDRRDMGEVLDWIKKESDLGELEMVDLRDAYLERGMQSVGLQDLLSFLDIRIDRDRLRHRVLNAIKWPIILLLATQIVTGHAVYWSAVREMKKVKAELNDLHLANLEVRERLDKHLARRQFWREFQALECSYPPILDLMEEVARVIDEAKGEVHQMRFADDRMTLSVMAPDISAIIDKLTHSGRFERLTLSSPITKGQKMNHEQASIDGVLRRLRMEEGKGN